MVSAGNVVNSNLRTRPGIINHGPRARDVRFKRVHNEGRVEMEAQYVAQQDIAEQEYFSVLPVSDAEYDVLFPKSQRAIVK